MMDTVPPPAAKAKDFLSILDLDHRALERLLDLAGQMKADRRLGPKAPTASALAGKHVALLFEKPSLRTRSTFEIAVRELGAHTLDLPAEFAQGVREPLEDIARNLERWVHALVLRTFGQDKALKLAAAGACLSVVNALTDEEHPCQALADVMTMTERWGHLRGRTVAYVGDGNNVATSLAQGAVMLGTSFNIASPSGYELPSKVVEQAMAVARHGAQIRLFRDPGEAVAGSDAVYTDVWTSMGQEDEAAERKRAFDGYQVTPAMMRLAHNGAAFMHCLPAHRNEEVATDVFESPVSVVFDQAENRLHSQKALLLTLMTNRTSGA
jgi:ornithine carbamoyltransferase